MIMRSNQRAAIYLKSPAEIAKMAKAGAILHRVLREVVAAVAPGITPLELDKLARNRIREAGAKPAFLGQYGFPNTLCVSVNEAVVHGIPTNIPLAEGDIVGIDCGVILNGFYADSAYSVGVGRISDEAAQLLRVAKEALFKGLEQCRPNKRLGDVGHAIDSHVRQYGYAPAVGYGGHGVGRAIHEEPRVENYGEPGTGERLRPGMTFAVEPMINAGTGECEELSDRWTVVTADGKLSAHFEHTVAIVDGGMKILTLEDETASWP